MRRPPTIDVRAGAPETCWTEALAGLPAWPPDELPVGGRALIVAPHPDDEVLACAGLMTALARRDVGLDVVGVTDGEASHPGGTVPPARLAARRRREATVADTRLGISPRRHWLGVADGGVAEREAWLAETLGGLLRGAGEPGLCIAPFHGDGHPDHEACGRAATIAAGATGAALVEYPVWAWHWARPDHGAIPLATARALALDPSQRARKAAAVSAHRSQLQPIGPGPGDGPVLTDAVLAHFRRPIEVFLR